RWVGEDDRRVWADRDDLRRRRAAGRRADRQREDRGDVLAAREADDRLDVPGPVHPGGATVRDVLARGALGGGELLFAHVVLDHREPERDLLCASDRRESLMNAQDIGVAS